MRFLKSCINQRRESKEREREREKEKKYVNGSPLGGVQHPELNAGQVCHSSHQSIEGVNLPDKIA
jgi:hypothetical protein